MRPSLQTADRIQIRLQGDSTGGPSADAQAPNPVKPHAQQPAPAPLAAFSEDAQQAQAAEDKLDVEMEEI